MHMDPALFLRQRDYGLPSLPFRGLAMIGGKAEASLQTGLALATPNTIPLRQLLQLVLCQVGHSPVQWLVFHSTFFCRSLCLIRLCIPFFFLYGLSSFFPCSHS